MAHRIRRLLGWKGAGIPLLALAAALALQGCFRGHWHGRYDAQRFEERMDWVQEELAEELEIQPHQQADFDALMAEYRQVARQWRDGWHATAVDVRGALEREPADAVAVGEALKQRLRERTDDATLERLIDRTVVFYNTLQPEQQEEVREHMLRHLRRRLG